MKFQNFNQKPAMKNFPQLQFVKTDSSKNAMTAFLCV